MLIAPQNDAKPIVLRHVIAKAISLKQSSFLLTIIFSLYSTNFFVKKIHIKKNTYDLLSFDKKSLHRETFC